MTEAQNNLYWRMWSRVQKLLVQLKVIEKKDASAKRHEIHKEALGREKSHLEFTNAEFDRVLDAFQTYLGLSDPRVSKRAVEMPRKREIFAIERLGFPDSYVLKVSTDKFNAPDWRNALNDGQLRQLKITLTERARSRARKDKAAAAREHAVSTQEPAALSS